MPLQLPLPGAVVEGYGVRGYYGLSFGQELHQRKRDAEAEPEPEGEPRYRYRYEATTEYLDYTTDYTTGNNWG